MIDITLCNNIYKPNVFKTIYLESALAQIKDGFYKAEIEALRSVHATQYHNHKLKLPAHLFAGTFEGSTNIAGFKTSSNLVNVDIDKFEELNLAETRDILQTMSWLRALWISPSGRGLKGLIKIKKGAITEDSSYKAAFKSICEGFAAMGIIVDPSCKDASRKCFVSWDPDLYDNPAASDWDLSIVKVTKFKETEPFTEAENAAARISAAAVFGSVRKHGPAGINDEKVTCQCIDHALHSDGNRGGAFYQIPNQKFPQGGFRCSHTHYTNLDKEGKRDFNRRFHEALELVPFCREGGTATKVRPTNDCGLIAFNGKGRPQLVEQSVAAQYLWGLLNGKVCYNAGDSEWQTFKGDHWAGDDEQSAKSLIRSIANEKLTPFEIGFSDNWFRGVFNGLKDEKNWIMPSTDSNEIPFLNGQLNMKTMAFAPTTPGNAKLWCLPYEYEIHSESCPETLQWLSEVLGDPAAVGYALAWMRVMLLRGGTSRQQFLHLYGKGGNGKSIFEKLIMTMLGENNVAVASLLDIETNRFTLARFRHKKLVLISDVTEYTRSVDNLKRLTGGDQVQAERKGIQNTQGFVFHGTVVMSSNTFISTSDRSFGLDRRRAMIPFSFVATEASKAEWVEQGRMKKLLNEIPQLLRHLLLMDEKEVNAALREPPKVSRDLVKEAITDASPVRQWVEDCIMFNTSSTTLHSPTDIFRCYAMWCDDNCYKKMCISHFTREFLNVMEEELRVKRTELRGAGLKRRHIKYITLTPPDGSERCGD